MPTAGVDLNGAGRTFQRPGDAFQRPEYNFHRPSVLSIRRSAVFNAGSTISIGRRGSAFTAVRNALIVSLASACFLLTACNKMDERKRAAVAQPAVTATPIPTIDTAITAVLRDSATVANLASADTSGGRYEALDSLSAVEVAIIEQLLRQCIVEYNQQAAQQRGLDSQAYAAALGKRYDRSSGQPASWGDQYVIRLADYKRQLVPFVNSRGEKEVYVNCCCDDTTSYWRKRLVDVLDGGSCYFQVRVNLTSQRYFDLSVNGNG